MSSSCIFLTPISLLQNVVLLWSSKPIMLATGLKQTILAMITSNLDRANHPSRIFIKQNTKNGISSGLRTDSVIMTDNIVTVLETEIDSILGSLWDMSAVNESIKHSFGLSGIDEKH